MTRKKFIRSLSDTAYILACAGLCAGFFSGRYVLGLVCLIFIPVIQGITQRFKLF